MKIEELLFFEERENVKENMKLCQLEFLNLF